MPVDININDALLTTPHLTHVATPSAPTAANQSILYIDSTTGQIKTRSSTTNVAYAILDGLSGGQTLNGDTASGGDLTLVSTAHATKGSILFGAAGALGSIDANGQLALPTTGSTGGLLIGGDVALYRSAADTLLVPDYAIFQNAVDSTTAFQVLDADGGTPVLNIDTTNERVGIRTAAPTEALHILDVTASRMLVEESGNSVQVLVQADTTKGFIGTLSAHAFRMGASGAEVIYINTGGQVGIGKSPGETLDINGNIRLTGASSTIQAWYDGTPSSAWRSIAVIDGVSFGGFAGSAWVDTFFISDDNSGVGINNTSPGAQLHVDASGSAIIGQIIKAAAAYTANSQEDQDSSGVIHNKRAIPGATSAENVFNEQGGDLDFRVESDTYDALFIDASNDSIDIMHNASGKIGFYAATPVVQAAAYTPTNVTPDRSFDADTVAVAELADVVGTMIADLQAYGLYQ